MKGDALRRALRTLLLVHGLENDFFMDVDSPWSDGSFALGILSWDVDETRSIRNCNVCTGDILHSFFNFQREGAGSEIQS